MLQITSHDDWSEQKLHDVWQEIAKIAKEEMELDPEKDLYPNIFEIVSSEQMIDNYASVGLPVMYSHWSFGKEFLKTKKGYDAGRQGLAFEIVINSNPCISSLMEDNDMVMQTMVMAHAGVGHNAVFKNNECFKQWTNAGSIVDYMIFARNYINQCEQRYGTEEVELVLDAAHTLAPHAVDKFKRKHKPAMSEEVRLQKLIEEDDRKQREMDIILKRTSFAEMEDKEQDDEEFAEGEENLMYFIMKKSPSLDSWKREILRIVYKVNQYFYPQAQCVTGDNLVATGNGLFRLDELINKDGYNEIGGLKLITRGDKPTDISHTFLRRKASVMKIQTAMGRTFIATPEHPLMALNGTQHTTTRLDQLSTNDYLVFNTNYENVFAKNEFVLNQVDLNEVIACDLCGFESVYLPTHMSQTHKVETSVQKVLSSNSHRAAKSKNMPSKFPTTLTADFAELLGHLQRSVKLDLHFSSFTFSGKCVDRICHLLDSVFGLKFGADSEYLQFASWGLREFLKNNFVLDGSIPHQIRKSPKNVIASYIKGVVDSASIKRTNISTFELLSYDKNTVNELQILLNSLGIISKSTNNTRLTYAGLYDTFGIKAQDDESLDVEFYSLRVIPSYKAAFENIIGTCLDLPRYSGNPKIASKNVIPGAKALLTQIADHIKKHKSAVTEATENMWWAQKRREGKLLKDNITTWLGDLPEIRGQEVSFEDVSLQAAKFENACQVDCAASTQLTQLIHNSKNVFYDKIISIEVLSEKHDVYDVTVPENHLFWMSGLISHNTKNLNEGFASFSHYYIMTRLEEKGILSSDAYISFLHHHSSVIYQPSYNSRHYSGINPYAIGFAIFNDIKRICENPTAEDIEWFPNLIGRRWQDAIKEAAFDYRDDGFISQFLSPKVIRDLKLFNVNLKHPEKDSADKKGISALVTEIHDDVGYRSIRTLLAKSMERINYVPQIKVVGANLTGDRKLKLKYVPYAGRSLHVYDAHAVSDAIDYLWGYAVELDC